MNYRKIFEDILSVGQGPLSFESRERVKTKKLAALLSDSQAKFLLTLIFKTDTDDIDTTSPALPDLENYEERLSIYHSILIGLLPRLSMHDPARKVFTDCFKTMVDRYHDLINLHSEIFDGKDSK